MMDPTRKERILAKLAMANVAVNVNRPAIGLGLLNLALQEMKVCR
jgi:hypothetical protein